MSDPDPQADGACEGDGAGGGEKFVTVAELQQGRGVVETAVAGEAFLHSEPPLLHSSSAKQPLLLLLLLSPSSLSVLSGLPRRLPLVILAFTWRPGRSLHSVSAGQAPAASHHGNPFTPINVM